MYFSARSQTVHFQIGEVGVSLAAHSRALRRDYGILYQAYRVDGVPRNQIHVDVRPRPRGGFHRRRWNIVVNDRLQFEPAQAEELLPYVEWAINWELPRALPQYLQIHAASMEINGEGVIFPGESGNGKSTLTTGLLARGWNYLCDEFALIDSESCQLHAYPRAICVKQPSFPVVRSLGLGLVGGRQHLKGVKGWVRFVNPLSVRDDAVGEVCPVRHVIFPKYTPGALPVLIPMSRAEAAIELHRVCFNLMTCRRLAVETIAETVREAKCYRLIAGELGATCDLVERSVREFKTPAELIRCDVRSA